VAPTPTAAADPIALMMLVASVAALAADAPDHHWKFGLVLEPSEPFARVPPVQPNVALRVPVRPMLFPELPGVLSVTVTIAPAEVAVSAETLVLIALASAVASLAKLVN